MIPRNKTIVMVFINVYSDTYSLHKTRESADSAACEDRIDCVERIVTLEALNLQYDQLTY